jgi:mono/diheme cytochrome c family protein
MNKHWLIVIALITALALVGCGGDGGNSGSGTGATNTGGTTGDTQQVASTGDPVAGEELFNQVCIACHGPGGEGIEGLGKPFTTSDFIPAQSDEELLEFIKVGRPVGHPDNTTGVDMPPKGGNPALTDEQIMDIIAYIRSVHD